MAKRSLLDDELLMIPVKYVVFFTTGLPFAAVIICVLLSVFIASHYQQVRPKIYKINLLKLLRQCKHIVTSTIGIFLFLCFQQRNELIVAGKHHFATSLRDYLLCNFILASWIGNSWWALSAAGRLDLATAGNPPIIKIPNTERVKA